MAKYASSSIVEIFKPEFMRPVGSTTLSRLRIPQKFFDQYLGERDDDVTVTLLCDQLSCPWTVTLDGQVLRKSWPEFAKALKLKVNDYLVFRYKGNYVFQVTAFGDDGEKLDHEHWAEPQGVTHGGNVSGGKGKGKQVEPHHGDIGRSHRTQNYGGDSPRSHRIAPDGPGYASPMSRGIRSQKTVASEEVFTFQQPVTESNIERNEVYIPKRFVDFICLAEKDFERITLTNNYGDTWVGVGKVSTDMRLRITGCWTMFCYENGLNPGDICKLQSVENADHIVLKLVGLAEDEEMELLSPGGEVKHASGSFLRIPKVEGSSKYSARSGRGERGQARQK